MRCLVTGAYGFIGRRIVLGLQERGCSVTAAGRDVAMGRRLLPDIDWIECDFNRDTDPAVWTERLSGFDAVVNCVGILQSTAKDDAARIHFTATNALFEGAAKAGARRVIHISAMSAEKNVGTEYAKTRVMAEEALKEMDLDWLIIKPSLVIGQGSYGGTSLMRGLAGLPYVLPLPGGGDERFQPIALEELADGIAALAMQSAPSREILYAAGPETVTVKDIILKLRSWLGFSPPKIVAVPDALLMPVLWFGDLAGRFGETSALRTASLEQMRVDDVADPEPFQDAAGIRLTSFSDYLKRHPSTLQDRLHARSYFAGPLLRIALSLFWILTGIIALLPSSFSGAVSFAMDAGLPEGISALLVSMGSVADILLGGLMLRQRTVRLAALGQIGLTLVYLIALSFVVPALWVDPFGVLLKAVPLIFASLTVMALSEER